MLINEARVKASYPDPVLGWAKATACEGHTGPEIVPGMTFTDEECDLLKRNDILTTFNSLDRCMPMTGITITELAAYLLLAINVGPGAVCRSSIPVKLKQHRNAEACATIKDFYKVNGLDCRDRINNCYGIVNARQRSYDICMTPSAAAT